MILAYFEEEKLELAKYNRHVLKNSAPKHKG